MIRPLRKRHLQVWSVLLVLLPAIIVLGRLAVPKPVSNTLLQQDLTKPLPNIIASKLNEYYTINLRSGNNSAQQQLEWINKKTLTTPTALVYEVTSGSRQLIGRIEARGTFHFMLPENNSGHARSFILFDFIHNQVIDTINF